MDVEDKGTAQTSDTQGALVAKTIDEEEEVKTEKIGDIPVDKYTKQKDVNKYFKGSGVKMVKCSLTLKTLCNT